MSKRQPKSRHAARAFAEVRVDPLLKRIADLEARSARLEAIEQRGLSYQGAWKDGRTYHTGMFVTDHGSVRWRATRFDPAHEHRESDFGIAMCFRRRHTRATVTRRGPLLCAKAGTPIAATQAHKSLGMISPTIDLTGLNFEDAMAKVVRDVDRHGIIAVAHQTRPAP